MVLVGSHLVGHLSLPVSLQKLSQLAVLTFRDGLHQLSRFLFILIQNGVLELNNTHQESVRMNVQSLINKVETVLLRIIAQNELLFARLAVLHDSAANNIVNVASAVIENEALVADPGA